MELQSIFPILTVIILNILCVFTYEFKDKPCKPRAVANKSIVCVCTAEYCDTVIREIPERGTYYKYVSSEAGLRFQKTKGTLQFRWRDPSCSLNLVLNPAIRYQTINGFGTAITDSAAINWKSLSDPRLMNNLIESYCGVTGLQYNMLRVPIGSTDFSTHFYTYNDYPEHDLSLSNFSLAYEDYEYKLPMIKACMKASNVDIDIMAATWSPPVWMKTNHNYTGYSRLKKKYLSQYADYHLKFMQKYREHNVSIWGITISNEPLDGTINFASINDLGWTLDYMAEYIKVHLGPKIRNSTFKNVKILTCDDQRHALTIYWNTLIQMHEGVVDYLDGAAVHFYMDNIVPASLLTMAMADYPDKILIASEASEGALPLGEPSVDLGSWSRAEKYFVDILEDLNNNVIGWLDWNACLNSQGGPTWLSNFVDSPVIVYPEAGEFVKQPMYYALGHFSKTVPRGSVRIGLASICGRNLEQKAAAFLTPESTIVVQLYNDRRNKESVQIWLGGLSAVIELEAKSFTTVEFMCK